MDEDAQRAVLARFAAERGHSLAALSRLIGRNATYLQQYIQRGSPRRLAEADRRTLARFLGVADSALGGPATPGLAAVPRLDLAASAGPGGLVDREAALGTVRFEGAFLRTLGVRAEAASIIRVQGDSMQPTLVDGDEILVDRGDRRVARDVRLMVVRIDGVLAVKRVRRQGDRIAVISDNPAYPPLDLAPDAVDPVGRVVWLGRRIDG